MNDQCDDISMEVQPSGGWTFVVLRDHDDGGVIHLTEDCVLVLHRFLTAVIERYNLA